MGRELIMCYTAQHSMNAFILNTVSSTLLYLYADNPEIKVIALTLLFTGIMQLFDWLFWTYPAPSIVNKVATKLAIIFNHLQPIVYAMLAWFFIYRPKPLPNEIVWAILFYTAVITAYTINIWNRVVTIGPNPKGYGLFWQWNYEPGKRLVYLIFMAVSTFIIWMSLTGYRRVLMVLVTLGGYIFSVLKYRIVDNIGRMWCYMANIFAAIFLVLEFLRRNSILKLS